MKIIEVRVPSAYYLFSSVQLGCKKVEVRRRYYFSYIRLFLTLSGIFNQVKKGLILRISLFLRKSISNRTWYAAVMQTSVQTIFGRNFCRGCNRIGRHFQGKHFSKWNRRVLQTPFLPILPMHQFLANIGMFDTQPMQYCTKSMINLYIFSDLNAVRRLMSNDSTPLLSHRNSASGTSRDSSISRKFGEISNTCPSCRMPFDKAKKRRLVDTCGHERCYACMFRNETCPICVASGE